MTLQLQIDKQTEIMKKYGPQETTYASLFDAKDIPLVQKFFKKIKTRKDPPEIIEYFDKCEQKWNDHDPDIKVGNKQFRFVQVARADDLPTFPGLIQCNKLAFGASVARWRYMGAGNDSREARPYQQKLFGEVSSRLDMTISGSMTRVGNSLRFVGIFTAGYATITVRESAVFRDSSGFVGPMLNRNVFSSSPITHVNGVLGFTLASLFAFAGVP
jgi:hypothetical protein